MQSYATMAVIAIAIATPPLGYVAFARANNRFRKLVWVTAFLTFDLILFGAFTRLTDSGLGCPDWPGCYGQTDPLSASESIRSAEAALPTGPVTMVKAWIEMLHRYLAMTVGLLTVVLLASSWRRWTRDGDARSKRTAWLTSLIFAIVCFQGALGAWTVTMKLQPLIVTAHLLGAMTLLALLVVLGLREQPASMSESVARLRVAAAIALAALVVQVALGGWVSANYAVLACQDFPRCQGQWVPPGMEFSAGFTLWRDLGQTGFGPDSPAIPFAALTAIHWTHRTFGWLAFAAIGWLVWRARKVKATRALAHAIAALLVAQFVTGVSTVLFQWPLAIAIGHSAGAAALIAALAAVNVRVWKAPRVPAVPIVPTQAHALSASVGSSARLDSRAF